MHDTGQRIASALKESHPEADVKVWEQCDGSQLAVEFKAGESRYVIQTPWSTDYRAIGYQVWLHRIEELMKGKMNGPKGDQVPLPHG